MAPHPHGGTRTWSCRIHVRVDSCRKALARKPPPVLSRQWNSTTALCPLASIAPGPELREAHMMARRNGISIGTLSRRACRPPRHRGHTTMRGFSLAELATTLAVAAVLFGLGMPGWQAWIASQQLANHAHLVMDGLNLARSEAI